MGLVENLRFARQRKRRTARSCVHLGMVRDVVPAGSACLSCVELGDTWVHLRSCMTCGIVGCCDSSKNRHASRHAAHAGHPIARSLEPGEDWWWCFVDATMVEQPRPMV